MFIKTVSSEINIPCEAKHFLSFVSAHSLALCAPNLGICQSFEGVFVIFLILQWPTQRRFFLISFLSLFKHFIAFAVILVLHEHFLPLSIHLVCLKSLHRQHISCSKCAHRLKNKSGTKTVGKNKSNLYSTDDTFFNTDVNLLLRKTPPFDS